MKVNTFIVGAPKAGTTSLHDYLNHHPDVSMSSVKEPNFFSSNEVESLYYNSSPISNINDYHQLFNLDKKVIGEASVSYLFYEEVPRRIYEYNSDAKIIIMLRDPIHRAHSHYLMDARLGFCNSSIEYIFSEPERFPQFFQQFFELGLYTEQINKFLLTFKKENILILFYEDLEKDTKSVVEEVYRFLGLEKIDFDIHRENTFLGARNNFISILYKQKLLRKIANILFNKLLVRKIKKVLFNKKKKPKLEIGFMVKLFSYFKEDINRLEELLKKDLSHWKVK